LFLAFQLCFDFDCLGQQLVACGLQAFSYLLLKVGESSAAKTFVGLLHQTFGTALIVTIVRGMERYISQQRSSERNDQVAKDLIFGLQRL
jgi:hypothetical protein